MEGHELVSAEEGFDMFEEPEQFRPPLPDKTRHVVKIGGLKDLEVELLGFHSLWAHCLWNAGVAVGEYISETPELVIGKSVLELGAGAGVPSIVAALKGADVVVSTDYPEDAIISQLAENLKANVSNDRANALGSVQLPGNAAHVYPLGYLWGADTAPLKALLRASKRHFDTVVLADLIFNHSEHHKMLQTVISCLQGASESAVAIVAFTHHRPHMADKDMNFFKLAGEFYGLSVLHIWDRQKEAMFPEDPGDSLVRSTIHCYQLGIPKGWTRDVIRWPEDEEVAKNMQTAALSSC